MNRRSFFSRAVGTAAAAVVAPQLAKAVPAPLSLPHSTTATVVSLDDPQQFKIIVSLVAPKGGWVGFSGVTIYMGGANPICLGTVPVVGDEPVEFHAGPFQRPEEFQTWQVWVVPVTQAYERIDQKIFLPLVVGPKLKGYVPILPGHFEYERFDPRLEPSEIARIFNFQLEKLERLSKGKLT